MDSAWKTCCFNTLRAPSRADMLVLGGGITAWQLAGIALVVAALACVMLGGLIRRR